MKEQYTLTFNRYPVVESPDDPNFHGNAAHVSGIEFTVSGDSFIECAAKMTLLVEKIES